LANHEKTKLHTDSTWIVFDIAPAVIEIVSHYGQYFKGMISS